jgi:hypothetical protein
VVVATVAATVYLQNPILLLLGAGVYLAIVNRIAQSPSYQAAMRLAAATDEIRQLIAGIHRLAAGARSVSIRRIDDEADRLATQYLSQPTIGTPQHLLAVQALKVVEMYLKISWAQANLADGLKKAESDGNELARRIAVTKQRLQTMRDPDMRHDIERTLHLDQQTLERIEERLTDRDKILYKLQALESAFNSACEQFYSPETIVGADGIEDTLVEAEALYGALEEVQHPHRLRQ